TVLRAIIYVATGSALAMGLTFLAARLRSRHHRPHHAETRRERILRRYQEGRLDEPQLRSALHRLDTGEQGRRRAA
ncbi:hypothetical protein, partial [Hydrogenophaga sp.]|uniref:hypothetical protein n=1 Tax=Hydrogenophaga sp. TaxID=1904254 RepID=UPI0025C0A120